MGLHIAITFFYLPHQLVKWTHSISRKPLARR